MGKETGISWTHHTHNFWWGCTRYSPGCEHCYAETSAERWGWDIWGPGKPRREFADKHNRQPISWNNAACKEGERKRVFCGSMMDWAETEAPKDQQKKIWPTTQATRWLDWLMLTKRTELILKTLPEDWSMENYPNVAMGTTIENAKYAWRAKALAEVPASMRFISAEPLLGPMPDLDLTGIDWVIVGGESGAGHRVMEDAWAIELLMMCREKGVAFFFKQHSGHFSGMEPTLEDVEYHEFPKWRMVPSHPDFPEEKWIAAK